VGGGRVYSPINAPLRGVYRALLVREWHLRTVDEPSNRPRPKSVRVNATFLTKVPKSGKHLAKVVSTLRNNRD
jgi:hypothetical protein